ncbi:CDP-alcohol phosphatidyltransferase family protein [uncultured Nocardioides sp.]|uniref:CDP-alcohol phosphatidyltransferase family protein n=1 Tax=uncultured Nocardioides sp. TaxID=198441 RepID=UPI0026073AB9|nr:CDP-alcohol phosphatidyltransferase family protein [uncultured Nocardioides sp.]
MSSLYALKPWYTRRLGRFVDAAVRRDLSPDLFTGAGVAGAVGAAAFVAAGWWLPALAALAVRLGGANLDGAVARARGVSRPWGFVLNEVGDRVSDLVVLGGLAVLAARTGDAGTVTAVAVAALAATLPTFASLAAAGAGATRRNDGPVGKTERCALVVVATAVPAWIVGVCAVVVVGSVVTAVVRLAGAHRELTGAGR